MFAKQHIKFKNYQKLMFIFYTVKISNNFEHVIIELNQINVHLI